MKDYVNITKGRKQKGRERNIVDLSQSLSKLSEWADFLTNDANKIQITHLLCDFLLQPDTLEKDIYVTKGEVCYQKSGSNNIEIQSLKCKQREADTRTMQHVYFASKEHDSACVVADDTDVLVLLLFVSNECNGELFFREGTQSSKKGILYHKVHTLFRHPGSNICSILPAFHSLTGCDLTNPFYGRSKFGSFKNLLKKPGTKEKLSSLSTDAIDVDDVTVN